MEEFLGLDAAGGAGLARLLESEWVQVEEQESGRPFREKVLLSENVRLPNGLATAAAVRFGLRPGCLIKDALNSLKEEQGKLHELGGTPHPDMETCLEMLEPRLRK